MILDERRKILNTFAIGMADVQLAYNALASEVIVIFNELSIDHYQDSLIAEAGRFKKLAIFRKAKDMNYVPENEMDVELVEEGDNLPYEVLLTQTGLPRMPRKDDMVLADGMLYSVHHVKPMNRDYKRLLQLIVYPERTTFIDTLHIYKSTVLNPQTLLPICDLNAYLSEAPQEDNTQQAVGLDAVLNAVQGANNSDNDDMAESLNSGVLSGEINNNNTLYEKEVVIDFVWGGKPEFVSLDKTATWQPFKSRIKMSINDVHPVIYIKGGMEVIQVII